MKRRTISTSPISSNDSDAHLELQSLDDLLDGFILLSNDLEFIYANKQALTLAGLTNKQLLGKKLTELYPGTFTKSTGKAIQKALKTKKLQQREVYYPEQNKWLLVTVYPVGNSLAIQEHDISIRKTNENNLLFLAKASKLLSASLEYEKTLKNLAEISVPAIADWCAVEILNETGSLELLALIHKNPKNIKYAMELRTKYPAPFESSAGTGYVLKTGKSMLYPRVTDEMIAQSHLGKRQEELVRKIGFRSIMIVPLLSKEKPIGVVTYVTSQTDRNYTEADLAMAEDLANRASLAIENSRLYKEAQNAIRLRNEFISIASHELKTPVTSIKAYGQVLQRRFLKKGDLEASNHLQKMDEQLNKLTSLIGDLLDVTKIETGKLMLRKEYYDLDELVKESIENIQRTIPQPIKLRTLSNCKVYGDKERTGQVIINFLTNAAKYSPVGKPIEVTSRLVKDDVEVCVKDFGVGIPKEKHHKVFERFYRVSGPRDQTYSGLGLGLYISSEIIKRQGGKIWVNSEVGKGSTFCFQLPIFIEN